MSTFRIRTMTHGDSAEVAELIYLSTNAWYERHGRPPVFSGGPTTTAGFTQVYDALDPGCGIVAQSTTSRRLAGSCFYHPRPTHVSLGIMNVHPNYAGQGIASALLRHITDLADRADKPIRLISSAINLDSFSLYSRAGFVPRALYQDMLVPVPAKGFDGKRRGKRRAPPDARPPHPSLLREAAPADVPRMTALELAISHIDRGKDHRYFLSNRAGIWHTSVCDGPDGALDGFLVSSNLPVANILGPGVARDEDTAAALIRWELDFHRGRTPLVIVPVQCQQIIKMLYALGARNCELHVTQVRGQIEPFTGVNLPTFLPESG